MSTEIHVNGSDNNKPVNLIEALSAVKKQSEISETINKDRIDVITKVAEIDAIFKDLLVNKLILPQDDIADDLLDENRPLGTFMMRVKLAFRLGLISHEFYSAMRVLSKIRNDCAHTPNQLDVFNDQSIAQKINSLYLRIHPELQDMDAITVGKKGATRLTATKLQFKMLMAYYIYILKDVTGKLKPSPSPLTEIIFNRPEQ